MAFARTLVEGPGKLPHPMRAGDGLLCNVIPDDRAAETDETLSIDNVSGGLIQQGTTLTSDVIYTLPTSVLVEAAWPEMDVGDALPLMVTNAQAGAFDVVIAVGAGMTAVGANNTLSVPPQSTRIFHIVKTSLTTHDLY